MKSKIEIDQGWKNFAKQYCDFECHDIKKTLEIIDIIGKEANSIYKLVERQHLQIRMVKLQKLATIAAHRMVDKHIEARLAFLHWCLH